MGGHEDGYPVAPALEGEKNLALALAELAAGKCVLSAHDSSEGGVVLALAEIAIGSGLGIDAELGGNAFVYSSRLDAIMYGEVPGRVIVSATENLRPEVERVCARFGLEVQALGKIGQGTDFSVRVSDTKYQWTIEELASAFEDSIPSALSA